MSAAALAAVPASIPSPTTGVWNIGPLPIRAYAMCILAGIVVAMWLTQKRIETRGGRPGVVLDVSAWAVPFGIIGGRLYHLITSPQAYFGEGGHPLNAFKIWEGGLGIWGAIALGALGAYIGCRRQGIRFTDFVDSAAPGVLFAQALGRFGNYFNNEIYGGPTDLPWGLKVYEWDQQAGHAVVDASGNPIVLGIFHPTFLYEAIYCTLLAFLLIWADRRFDLKAGQVFAAYVAGYPVGRIFFEFMRTDDANHILGLRVNVWVSVLVFLFGVGLFVWFGRRAAAAEPEARDPQGGSAGSSQHSADQGSPETEEPTQSAEAAQQSRHSE